MKQALDSLELQSFPKTSGADGIHILVPITRRHTYDDTREFVEIIARARTGAPGVTTEWTEGKAPRGADRLQPERRGKAIASVYSVRPKEGAPVSTPLRWRRSTPAWTVCFHDGSGARSGSCRKATSYEGC